MPIIKSKDVIEVEKLTKDIKKVSDAVDVWTKSNEALSTSLQNVKKSNDGTEAKKLAEGTNKLTKSTKKLKDALTAEEKVKQDILRANVKLAQSRTKAAKDLALVKQKTLEQNKALREQAKAQLGVRKGISSLAKQMFAGIGIIAGFRALGSVLKNALKIYKDFEKASSKLAAILGKNKDDIKALTDQAKELGSTTAFTAKEVIGLQTELAKLGFSLREIEASTPGILDLAAATGSDLANAAEIAGATLRIFNLDASQMSRVTDVLALSTTKSSLSMEKLATILPTVGKTAEIAGVSLEKTVALAGTLTDRGLEASVAATSLRNIFLELSKKGITWNEAMSQINESTDKNKTSMDLFGKRAAAAGVILSETATSTDELTTALNDANGAAKEMSKTMLDNLAGDITIAESAWEGFINSLITGEGVISKISRGLTQFFTSLVGELTQLNNGASIALIQLKNVQDFEGRLEKFRIAKIDQLKKIESAEEKKIKLEGRSAILTSEATLIERKLKREREGSLELSKEEKTELEFNRDLLLEKVKILNQLIPIEKKQTTQTEDQTKATKDLNTQLKEENRIREERQKDLIPTIDGIPGSVILTNKQKLEDEKALIEDNARAEKDRKDEEQRLKDLARSTEIGEEKALILEQLERSGTQLASDIFSSFQDEKLAKSRADADAEKAILQDRLDKGLISEEQFASEVAKIEQKQRIESAKAEKKKALFDIAIATAVGIIKALAALRPGLAVAIGVAGGIQAAAVAAKPIPFNKGIESVPGEGNKDTVPALLTPGERVVPAEINQMLNGIPNSDLPKLLNKQDNNMMLAGLLMSGNKHAENLVTLMGNMGYTVTRNKQTTHFRADGSSPETFIN